MMRTYMPPSQNRRWTLWRAEDLAQEDLEIIRAPTPELAIEAFVRSRLDRWTPDAVVLVESEYGRIRSYEVEATEHTVRATRAGVR